MTERLEDVLGGGWVNGPTDDTVNTVPSVVTALTRLDPADGDLLEVGLRRGGTALARHAARGHACELVTVDPYGGLPYLTGDGSGEHVPLYGDDDERVARELLAREHRWQHWRLTSRDFFRLVAPLGYWRGGARRPYLFSSVFLDGSHDAAEVVPDLYALPAYLTPAGTCVVDNTDYPQPGPGRLTLRDAVQVTCAALALTCWPLVAGATNEVCVVSRVPVSELRDRLQGDR